MKKILSTIAFIFFVSICFGQSGFDLKLSSMADSIANKINSKGKKKVAVWDFIDNDGQVTSLGKYIAEELSVDLTNAAITYNMIDRNHLSTIMKEHQLNAEGFIDINTAKELGKINAVDAIVTGTISIFPDKIKVSIKVLDTETALIIAAVRNDLPMTDDIAYYIGIPGGNAKTNNNMGFNNRPLNSSEQYNNPETVSKDCQQNNTGDFCFLNKKSITIKISLGNGTFTDNTAIINPGQQQCFYNVEVGPTRYLYTDETHRHSGFMGQVVGQGQINIEKCKSKTFIVE